jgi:DNA-binding transcriptional ArsR family regulator
MAAKKIKSELESVRGDIKELTEAVWAIRDYLTTEQAVAAAEHQARTRRSRHHAQPPTTESLAALASETSEPGYLSTFGVFASPNGATASRAYRWSLQEQPVTALLDVPTDLYAQVLAAIGHKQRLGILLHLLAHPSTATEMVSALALGTTGAAYHHLNVLQAAGLVEQEQRGVFAVVPNRVPALLTILAGLSGTIEVDVVDTAPHAPDEDASAAKPEAKKGKKAGD